jgi:DNA/RNA-binding domain of Phe-tRNA-synthetase-like protein
LKIRIDSSILSKLPQFKVGVIFYEDITISSSPQMIKGRLQLYQESISLDLETLPLVDYKGVSEWRKVFKQLGMDPSKYRPSHEAMLRRIAKRDFVNTIHSAADINNFFSIQYGIPIGIYDLHKVSGDIVIKIGGVDETYDALNNRVIDAFSKIVSTDDHGPFGSPFVDSKRTSVTEETTSAVQIVYLKPSMTSEGEINELLNAMSKMFTQVNGGTAVSTILNNLDSTK